jgi:hypothetical protein
MISFVFAVSLLPAFARNQASAPRHVPSDVRAACDISGSFKRAEKTGDASVRLRESFMGAAWEERGAYRADGTDGTSFAFRKGVVAYPPFPDER